jgi:predicted nucleic acid-binding protein
MPAHADGYLSILFNQSEFIETVPSLPAMTRDANDEYLVALAVHANVDALVSDDNHLLELQEIPGKDRVIPVRTSRQFLTFLEKNNLLE